MIIEPFRLVAFLHVLLFVYWLGADLGVMLTSLASTRKGIGAEAKARLSEVGALIDMAPRTCLVLMVPVGLTLAQNYGSPVTGPALWLVWIVGLIWVWLVWQVHWRQGSAVGETMWRIDFRPADGGDADLPRLRRLVRGHRRPGERTAGSRPRLSCSACWSAWASPSALSCG